MILALEPAPANAAVAIPSLDALMRNLWDRFHALSPLEAGLLLLPIGLVFLLYGFKLYKLLVSVVFAGIGAGLGGALAAYLGWNVILGTIAGALVLGLLAWPLHRIAWGLLGGAILGGAAVLLVSARSQDPILLAIVATVIFAGGFILTLLVMRPLIILVTAILGAAVLVRPSCDCRCCGPRSATRSPQCSRPSPTSWPSWSPFRRRWAFFSSGATHRVLRKHPPRRKRRRPRRNDPAWHEVFGVGQGFNFHHRDPARQPYEHAGFLILRHSRVKWFE